LLLPTLTLGKGTCSNNTLICLILQGELQDAIKQFQEFKQEYDEQKLREQVYETVKAGKVVSWLAENCQVRVLPAGQA
jgi:hypothetical protein